MAKKLDRSKPFGTISRLNPDPKDPSAFVQDGIYFDSRDEACGEVPGFREAADKRAAEEAERAEAAEQSETADRAAAILGGLGEDPAAEAQRENAAAEAAENLSDDAPQPE